MKADCASSTALLIARGVLLAEATPSLRPLLVDDSAVLTRRLLNAAEPARWFDFALRNRWVRAAIFATERVLLPGILLHWLARKRWIDALAQEALAAGCRQVVVLGAGLDTLAWRLPAEVCFELDHPATQAIKRRAFGGRNGAPVLVAADLLHASPTALLRSQPRFDVRRPTLFVAEGLLMYLPPARVAELFRELATLVPPGSRFLFTFMETRPGQPLAFHTGRRAIDWWLRLRGEPFCWGLASAAVDAFAAEHGWELASISSPDDLRRRFLVPHALEHAPLAAGESVALLLRPDSPTATLRAA